VSRRRGEGREDEAAVPLNGGLFLASIGAIPLSILFIVLTPMVFPYFNSDPAVIDHAVPYLQVRMIGMLSVGVNFCFRGFWNGMGFSMIYMRTLVMMHIVNIVISYGLVFGAFGLPEMGSVGAGIGTTASLFFGTALYFFQAWKKAKPYGFWSRLPQYSTLQTILKLSIPSSIQQVTFAAGLVAMFWIVGMIGTVELAAASILNTLVLTAILPGIGLGLAAATLVGHSLGKKDPDDAKQWGWDVVKLAVLLMAAIGLPMLVMPEAILSIFTTDAHTIEIAVAPLRLIGATIFVDGIGTVLLNALLGAGASKVVLRVSLITQWGLFLPVAWLVGPVLGFGLFWVWASLVGYRWVQAMFFSWIWQKGRWQDVKL
jgi:putative MATE family efflux protein